MVVRADTPGLIIWVMQELGEVGNPTNTGACYPEDSRLPKLTRARHTSALSVKGFDVPSLCFKGSSDTGHTSKYFGSIDSSENNHRAEVKAEGHESEHFIKCVLQDPVWLLMADTHDSVMMTYQMPSR